MGCHDNKELMEGSQVGEGNVQQPGCKEDLGSTGQPKGVRQEEQLCGSLPTLSFLPVCWTTQGNLNRKGEV